MSDIVGTLIHARLVEAFRRYLFTAHRIAESDPELREALWEALGRDRFIAQDPLLTTIPSYATGLSLRELAARQSAPQVHELLLALGEADRPLYEHQVAAIAAIQRGNSAVIATGTGSGKTESFLLPILDDVLRNKREGVRALIVYPLNALANDQLRRLRQMLVALPDVTFGRYTGESPKKATDLSERELAEVLRPNERVSREEMRDSPPHIVLTNFAMLEYLLLRPQDSPLFDAGSIRYVVLDEAHVYQGAQGIDVGLLMRRLNRRVGRPLQYVLTSATLGGDAASIQQFAYNLTGAIVDAGDIIVGRATTTFNPHGGPLPLDHYAAFVPNENALQRWAEVLDDPPRLTLLLRECGVDAEGTAEGLYKWLHRDVRLAALHDLLSRAPRDVGEASKELWGEDSARGRVVTEWLCMIGARARRDEQSSPLLPARYHYLLRGLRGATLCLARACSGHRDDLPWSHLMLEGRATCERCDSHVVPIVTCFSCGLPVVKVAEVGDGQQWQQPVRGSSQNVHLLTWNDVVDEGADDGGVDGVDRITFCVSCRRFNIIEGDEPCCPRPQHLTLHRLQGADVEGNLRRCPNCASESRGFPSILREFVTGEDAAGAVLMEELLRSLPDEDRTKPVGGRRVLAFSDSRQRAAFFAPYLSRTTGETQVMAPLLRALRAVVGRDERSGTVDEIAREFAKQAERQPFVILRKLLDDSADEFRTVIRRGRSLAADDRSALRKDAGVALFRHMVAPPRRKETLSGLALAAVRYDLSEWQRDQLAEHLPRHSAGLDSETLERVVQSLIRVIVRRQALRWPDEIHPSMLGPGPNQAAMHRSDSGAEGGRNRVRWNSYRASVGVANVVRRSPQLGVLAATLGCGDPLRAQVDLEPWLEGLWEALIAAEVLEQFAANEYVLASDRLIFATAVEWMKCSRCGVVTPDPPARRCLLPGCDGVLRQHAPDSDADVRDHQRRRFTDADVLPVNVKEHTAQLTQSTGREYQRQFTEGDINVLSCSTTFEMGVDVGQLRAVYLRNVPPTASNYIQRAGRAGRRREGVALALTYARNMPHDQATFHDATELLSGTVNVPRVSIENPKLAQRHANAWILGAFVASTQNVQDNATVDEFFVQPDQESAPQAAYGRWVETNRAQLSTDIAAIIADSSLDAEQALGDSVRGLLVVSACLSDELAGFARQAEALEVELANRPEDPVGTAKALERVKALRQQTLEERLIDRLSSDHWLPSYAFPQDVLRLRVMEAELATRFKLERDAEYGISEYAPGAEVIADGRVVISGALDLRGRTAHVRRYRICHRCHNVELNSGPENMQGACIVCGALLPGAGSLGRPFVVPRGFSTVFDNKAQEVRFSRITPPRNTEVFLVRGAPPDSFIPHAELKGLSYGLQQDGELFLANSGVRNRGFLLCLECGRYASRGGPHRTPWGARCGGKLSKNDLAYEFKTDTLQIRFDGVAPPVPLISDDSFWTSFEMATISAAADYLKIAPRDINATHRAQKAGGRSGELVIYDRVPGGAGYVKRIIDSLRAILVEALGRMRDCKNPLCDIQGACDTCLRTYYNQMEWDKLRRQTVVEWLEPALDFMRSG